MKLARYCKGVFQLFVIISIVSKCVANINLNEKTPSIRNDIVNRIDEFINGIIQCSDLPGVSLSVVKDGEVFLTKGYGVKNLDTQEQMTEDTLVLIASVSKAFSTTLMAKTLEKHQEHGITWTSKVKDILQDAFNLEDPYRTEQVTITDLFSHKTGLPRHDLPRTYGHTAEELVGRMQYLNFTREFREVYKYNNLMYGVAQFVIETLEGGIPWEDQLEEKLLAPLGMDKTTVITRARDRWETELASVYSKDESGNLRIMSPEIPAAFYGTISSPGGVVSTARDMAKWLRFHIKEGLSADGSRIVDRTLMRDTHRPSTVSSAGASLRKPRDGAQMSEQKIALGWREGHYEGYRMSSHSGNIGGWLSLLSYLRDVKMGVFVSINGPVPDSRPLIHSFIYDLLLGNEPWIDVTTACQRLAPPSDHVSQESQPHQVSSSSCHDDHCKPMDKTVLSSELEQYEGTYGHFGYGNITFTYSDEKEQLMMTYGDRIVFDLFTSMSEGEFLAKGQEPFWYMTYDVKFEQIQEGLPPNRVSVSFEPELFPIFERDLKFADAPPPATICPTV